jgi:fumarate hydratase class II
MDAEQQFRTERDSMGEVKVPAEALWRAQTQRAIENFPISGTTLESRHIHALAAVKAAAAQVNAELGVITDEQATAIRDAAAVVMSGDQDDQFPLDVFQTGSGTSSNMNMNEVLATLASQAGVDVHPNDHVNASQSATTPSRRRSTWRPRSPWPRTWSPRSAYWRSRWSRRLPSSPAW